MNILRNLILRWLFPPVSNKEQVKTESESGLKNKITPDEEGEGEVAHIHCSLMDDGEIRIECYWLEENMPVDSDKKFGEMIGFLTTGYLTNGIFEVLQDISNKGRTQDKEFVVGAIEHYQNLVQAITIESLKQLGLGGNTAVSSAAPSDAITASKNDPIIPPSKAFFEQ